MASAMIRPPSDIQFVIPLGRDKRENVELELAKKLATGKSVDGGIFFTSKDCKFVYLRCEGDTEVPLRDQVPLLKSQDRDLGLKRNTTHSIYFVKANPCVYARLFVRVLKGCSPVQIQAAVQYVNSQLDPSVTTFPGNVEKYEQLVFLCRDVLYPGFRYFTRHNRMKPYMWVPIAESPPDSLPTLGEYVHNTSYRVAVDMAPHETETSGWPETDNDVAGTKDTTEAASTRPPPCTEMPADQSNENHADAAAGGSGSSDQTDSVLPPESVNKPSDDFLEKPDGDHCSGSSTDSESSDEAGDVARDEARDEEPLPSYSEDDEEGDSDAIEEIGSECANDDDTVSSVFVPKRQVSIGGQSKSGKGKFKGKGPGPIKSSKTESEATKAPGEKETKDTEAEEILSGNLNIPGVKPITVPDNRPVSLRRLQEALPKNKAAIPDGVKQKLAFSMLVLNIRELEIEYNRDNNVDADLPELDESKTLNQREVKRELKHLLELMSDRDQWESERRVQQVKAIVDTRKKKNTIAGKKLEAQKYEEIERQRLLNKSSLDANTSINFEVDHGPRLPGLSGFGMFRKQKQQIREYNKRKQAKEKLERNKLLSRNSSMSSTGSIKPLTTVLEKQSRGSARGKAQASAQAKAFDEINGDGQERDLNSDSFVKRLPGATERSLLAESLDIYDDEDDFVFAKPNETSVPRGYVKANTLRLMKEVYKQQSNLINTSNSMFKELNAQVKSMDKRQRQNSKLLSRHCSTIKKLQTAFFDYDVMTHQQLCDVESEFHEFFPLDELGLRTDFVFSDPPCAKTIAKRVITNLNKDGTQVPNLTTLVNETARVCFSPDLRAHMHIVKSQWKQTIGWWRVGCPASFQDFLDKYILSRLRNSDDRVLQNGRGWRQILYSHFKNTGETHFNYKCKAAKSQAEFVKMRLDERIKLQRKHFDEEVENRELIIPTLDEEMESYSRHSENYEDGEDLRNSQEEKSQRETQNPPKEEKKFKPLPTLEELQVLSARLKEAIAASVGAQKEAKKNLGENDLSRTSPTEDLSDGTIASPARKRKKLSPRKAKTPPSAKKRRPPTPSTSEEDSDSAADDKVIPSEHSFRKRLNTSTSSTVTSTQASVPASKRPPVPMGKPKSYAQFCERYAKKEKSKRGKRFK